MTKKDKFETDLRFNDATPEGAAYRAEQAAIDADIEGLARDEGAERLIAEMDKLGLSPEERIERLSRYFREEEAVTPAAE